MDYIDLAERVGAAADLDDQPRGRFDMEMEFGDAEYALIIAVVETRKSLPADLLTEVRRAANVGYSDSSRDLLLAAVDRQNAGHR
ncbi:hypothetical protein [Mycobacterium sp. DBP42]|uniref:hypothetical protein n=1 Tax=Mycobacterium sp. DBP42 TaxID=2545267 RepID=UPI00110CA1D3|nr:hypothetical protein [Mycobacterium sp. DBP42]TMS53657.1 hypothetical protein E0T84_10020 [Mycobacterium sp. DBP42]